MLLLLCMCLHKLHNNCYLNAFRLIFSVLLQRHLASTILNTFQCLVSYMRYCRWNNTSCTLCTSDVTGAPNIPDGMQEFSCGDVVRVELDTEMFMLFQEGHGGWTEKMTAVRIPLSPSLSISSLSLCHMIIFFFKFASASHNPLQLKGRRGVIQWIKDSGDLLVLYDGSLFVINPAAVVKVCSLAILVLGMESLFSPHTGFHTAF